MVNITRYILLVVLLGGSMANAAPKVGEFKYLTQGIVCLGQINVAFTILTNDGQESVIKAALDALREALQVTTTA